MWNTSKRASGDAKRLLGLVIEIGRHNSLRDPLTPLLEGLGFTHAQLHALTWLGYDGRLTMGALARRVGATDKTITGIVDRLEDKKCIRRCHDANDRRVVTAELTPKGRASFEKIHSMTLKRAGALLSCLEEAERGWLFRILGRLAVHGRDKQEQP